MKTIVSLKNIVITRQNNQIIKDVSFTLNSQQHLAIIGANGAGKSFLLRVLSADMIPSSGQVVILEQEFGKTSLWNLRKQIGFVSSRLAFWYEGKTTVNEVIASGFHGTLGLPEEITTEQQKQIEEILELFQIQNLKQRIFETLSDGEKRKVLLTRALILKPKLLVFDEPCQGLDIPTREILLQDIEKLAKNIPIIYVTHHLEELPFCITDILLLKKGEIFKQGSKQDILNSDFISQVFDYPIQVIEKNNKYYSQI